MAIEKSGKWGLKPLDSSTPDGINLQLYISGHMCCVVGSLHGAAVIPKEHVFAYGPKTGPAFLRFFALWYVGGRGVGGCSNVLCLRYHRFSWVTTLHVMLHISVVHRWTHFMLHCTFPLYFGEHTSCYLAHFCCTSVTKLHVTLYIHFCCTSVTKLHVTLHTSVVLQWTHCMLYCTLLLYFSEHTNKNEGEKWGKWGVNPWNWKHGTSQTSKGKNVWVHLGEAMYIWILSGDAFGGIFHHQLLHRIGYSDAKQTSENGQHRD